MTDCGKIYRRVGTTHTFFGAMSGCDFAARNPVIFSERSSIMNLIKNKRKQLLASIDLLMYIIVYIVGNILSSVTAGGAILRAGGYAVSVLLFAVAIFGTRVLFAVYADVWRYANSRSYLALMGADFFGGAIALLISSMIPTVYLCFWQIESIIAALDIV